MKNNLRLSEFLFKTASGFEFVTSGPVKFETVLYWNFGFSMKWCIVFLADKIEWQIIRSAEDESTVI